MTDRSRGEAAVGAGGGGGSGPPDWVSDAVFYQIFPDRFARSGRVEAPGPLEDWDAAPTRRGYKGGDLPGIADRLDHLADLGVNAIYLNPIFRSASNHRYHTHDYEVVDPMLGGNGAFRDFLEAARGRGMRVVLDGVFNHTGRGFFAFHDILENGESSPYRDWYTIERFPVNAYGSGPPGYHAWWNLPELPKLNTRNARVRAHLMEVARRWIEFGADGWRLDVPDEIDDDGFWREFRAAARGANAEAYIVGEVWRRAGRWLRGDMWDAVMNYPLLKACLAFFGGEALNAEPLRGSALHPPGPPDAERFRDRVLETLSWYSAETNRAMLNLVGSHDTPRIRTLLGDDPRRVALAWLYLNTHPGAPCAYYGDEIGMRGGADPANRGAFPWNAPEGWDEGTRDAYRRAIRLRSSLASLRRGDYVPLFARGRVHAHARRLGDETTVVAINAGTRAERVEIACGRPPGGAAAGSGSRSGSDGDSERLPDLWNAGDAVEWVRAEDGEARLRFELEPLSARVVALRGWRSEAAGAKGS